MTNDKRFSERQGYSEEEPEISIREDAPDDLRWFIINSGKETGLELSDLRDILCRVLMIAPNSRGNWSPTNISNEILNLIDNCEWFIVYDIIEEIYKSLTDDDYKFGRQGDESNSNRFEKRLNKFFNSKGIGWQLIDGIIEIRGDEIFEHTVRNTIETLEESNRQTAKSELKEALKDISRRPDPDITGSIQHSMAALECVARDITGESKATFGQIINNNPEIVPLPLNVCLEKAWGYASEMGRHIREGREPNFEEALLLLGLSAASINYMVIKFKKGGKT